MDALYFMERVMGIEPTSSAWKADALADVLHPHICEVSYCKMYSSTNFALCQSLLEIIIIYSVNLLIINVDIRNHNWWNTAVCCECCNKCLYIWEKSFE